MYIKVRVKTAQRKEVVTKRAPDNFEMSLKEKPEHNAANNRVLALLAREFNIVEKKIRFISGQRSPSKKFEILGL